MCLTYERSFNKKAMRDECVVLVVKHIFYEKKNVYEIKRVTVVDMSVCKMM